LVLIMCAALIALLYAATVIGIMNYVSFCDDIDVPNMYLVVVPAIAFYALVKITIDSRKLRKLRLLREFNALCIVAAQTFSYVLQQSNASQEREVNMLVIKTGTNRVEEAMRDKLAVAV